MTVAPKPTQAAQLRTLRAQVRRVRALIKYLDDKETSLRVLSFQRQIAGNHSGAFSAREEADTVSAVRARLLQALDGSAQ